MAKSSEGGGSERFDPRFSPEFQPGFDARVHRESPPKVSRGAAVRVSSRAIVTRTVARVQDASPGPDSAVDAEEAAETVEGTVPAGVGSHVAGDGGGSGDDEHPAWWRRLNPYLVGLGVSGVTLIAAAVGWMAWVYSAASNPYTQQSDYLIMQFAMFGAPMLLSVGAATLVSILVVQALRWRR